jgi:hypothetical protein
VLRRATGTTPAALFDFRNGAQHLVFRECNVLAEGAERRKICSSKKDLKILKEVQRTVRTLAMACKGKADRFPPANS